MKVARPVRWGAVGKVPANRDRQLAGRLPNCAEGSLTTQQASFVDHVAVVLEHFLGLLEHLQEAYLQAGALQGRSCQEWVACRPGRASSCFA
jgi:hypothetical protein